MNEEHLEAGTYSLLRTSENNLGNQSELYIHSSDKKTPICKGPTWLLTWMKTALVSSYSTANAWMKVTAAIRKLSSY